MASWLRLHPSRLLKKHKEKSGSPSNAEPTAIDVVDTQQKPKAPQDMKQATDESISEDASNPDFLSLQVPAAVSEEQQSYEQIKDDLMRKIQVANADSSKLQAEIRDIVMECGEENEKVDSVAEKLAKFATPEFDENRQTLLGWLETELLQRRKVKTFTVTFNSYFNEHLEAIDADHAVLGYKFEDLMGEQSAAIKDVEMKESEQEEEVGLLRKAKSEFERMFKYVESERTEKEERAERLKEKIVKDLEAFDTLDTMSVVIDESSTKIRSIEEIMDSHGERFMVLKIIFHEVNKNFLTELSACMEEFRMEKTKLQTLRVEKKELTDENDELIVQFLYMDTIVLILQRGVEMLPEISEEGIRKAVRHLCSAIQDHHGRCNQILQIHKATP